jgi:glycosyltransferase involved in cell wall biosynthesis
VPARYGGFETAVEEIGRRLAARGHDVTVYCRRTEHAPLDHHLGMRLVTLPALHSKSLETLSHSAVAVAHAVARDRPDVTFLFNSANAGFLPLLRARRIPVAVHVDGLEWQRSKWSGTGQRYYRAAEALAVRWADALIADAPGIAGYYEEEFGASTELLTYGAPVLRSVPDGGLAELGLTSKQYCLAVARFEPENHLDLIVRGYRASSLPHPLVVVGSAPYGDAHTATVHAAAAGDERIRFTGAVWDQDLLDQLYAHARLYLHGHSVGGTNPSLLRAMGAGTAVAAYAVRFNRDVLGEDGWFFSEEADLAVQLDHVGSDLARCTAAGARLQTRAAARFRWDDVADGYADLARRLAGGASRQGEVSGRRAAANRRR